MARPARSGHGLWRRKRLHQLRRHSARGLLLRARELCTRRCACGREIQGKQGATTTFHSRKRQTQGRPIRKIQAHFFSAAISESLEPFRPNRASLSYCCIAFGLPGVNISMEDSRVFELDWLEGFVLFRSSRQREGSGGKRAAERYGERTGKHVCQSDFVS